MSLPPSPSSTSLEEEEKKKKQKAEDKKRCDGYVSRGLSHNKTIQYLLGQLEELGCTPPPGLFRCTDCGELQAAGGFQLVQEERVTTTTKTTMPRDDNNSNNNHNKNCDFMKQFSAGNDSNMLSMMHYSNAEDLDDKELIRKLESDIDKTNEHEMIQKIAAAAAATTTTTKAAPAPAAPAATTTTITKAAEGGAVDVNCCGGGGGGGSSSSTTLMMKPEIFLCQEHALSENATHRTMIHELIHAMDTCRSHMDPKNNCIHLACTEIRAENLSGDCQFWNEFWRIGPHSFQKHAQDCVQRRATLSVQAHPKCQPRAKEYVQAAMNRCYNDTFPFERHPNEQQRNW